VLTAGFYVASRAQQACEHPACDMPSGCVSSQVSRTNSLQGPSLVRPRPPASRNKNLMGSRSRPDLLSPQSTARRPIFPAGEEVSQISLACRPAFGRKFMLTWVELADKPSDAVDPSTKSLDSISLQRDPYDCKDPQSRRVISLGIRCPPAAARRYWSGPRPADPGRYR